MNITCPNCGTELTAAPEHIGKKVKCQNCQTAFVVQAPVAQPAAPVKTQKQVPIATPTPAEIGFDASERTASFAPESVVNIQSKDEEKTIEARSWFELFNPGLRSFLTPKIVRLVYGGALLFAAIGLILNTLALLSLLFAITSAQPQPNNPFQGQFDGLGQLGRNQDPFAQFNQGMQSAGTQVTGWAKLFAVLWIMLQYLFILYGVLVARLVCEAIMIQYDKANSLRKLVSIK